MKKYFGFLFVFFSMLCLLSGCKKTNASCELELTSTDDSVSYSLSFKDLDGKQTNYKIEILKGDVLVDNDTFITEITAGTFYELEMNISYTVKVYLTDKSEFDFLVAESSVWTMKGTMTGVELPSATYAYDGTAKALEIMNLPQGAIVEYTGNNRIEAGVYEVIATVKKENYNDLVLKASLTITKTEGAFDLSDKEVVYDGNPQTIQAETELPLIYEYYIGDMKLDFAPVNAGEYKVKAIYMGDDNHSRIEREATLTIHKATYDMSGVVFEDKEYVYDGTEKTIVISGVLPEGVTAEYADNVLTNAGSITAHAVFTGNSENYYPIPSMEAVLTIQKADITLTASDIEVIFGENYEVEYDCSLDDSLIEIKYFDIHHEETAKPDDIGVYTAVISFAGNPNYKEKTVSVSITIKNPDYQDIIIGLEDIEITYGQSYEVNPTANQGVTADRLTVEYRDSDNRVIEKPVSAGNYRIVVSFPIDHENFLNPATKTVSLTIHKATYDMSGIVFENKEYVYDGTEKSLTVEGVLPEGVIPVYTENTLTNPGSLEVTVSFTGDSDNYNPVEAKTAVLTVVKKTLTITQAKPFVYGDKVDIASPATYAYSGITAEDWETIQAGISFTFADSAITAVSNAGSYDIKIDFAGTDFINAVDATISIVVDKAQHIIELLDLDETNSVTRVASSEFTYTVSAEQDSQYSYSADLRYAPAGVYSDFVITYPENENYFGATVTINVILTEPVSATDLFISEYYEGKSNNKFIILYNGTGKDVDLAEYSYATLTNGAKYTTAVNFTPFTALYALNNVESMILSTGTKLALCYKSGSNGVSADIQNALTEAGCTIFFASNLNYNGNDSVVLLHNGNIIDIFGVANGINPGDGWSFGGVANATMDHHFVRASYVFHPTALYREGYYLWNAEEWICYNDLNDFSMTANYTMDLSAEKVGSIVLKLAKEEYGLSAAPSASDIDCLIYAYQPELRYYTFDGTVYTELSEKPSAAGTYYIGFNDTQVMIAGKSYTLSGSKAVFYLGENQYVNGYMDGEDSKYISIYADTTVSFTREGHSVIFKQVKGIGFKVTYNAIEYIAAKPSDTEYYQVSFDGLVNAGTYTFEVFAESIPGEYISYTHVYNIIIEKADMTIEALADGTTASTLEYNESGHDITVISDTEFTLYVNNTVYQTAALDDTSYKLTYLIEATADGAAASYAFTAVSTDTNYNDYAFTVVVNRKITGSETYVEQVIYSTGFESAEGFTAGTVYNNSTVKNFGEEGKQWGVLGGTASTTDKIADSQSVQMRWYTSAPERLGYAFTDFDLEKVTAISFQYKSTGGLKLRLSYSMDSGQTWVEKAVYDAATAATEVSVVFTEELSANVRFKFEIVLPDSAPSTTSRLTIDCIEIKGNVLQ